MSTETDCGQSQDCNRVFNRNGLNLMGLDLEEVEVKEEISLEFESEADCNNDNCSSNSNNNGTYIYQTPNPASITSADSIGHHVPNEMSLPPDENDDCCSVVSVKDEIVDPVVEMDIAAEADSLFVPDVLVHFSSSDRTRHLAEEHTSLSFDTPLSCNDEAVAVAVTAGDCDCDPEGEGIDKDVVIDGPGIGTDTDTVLLCELDSDTAPGEDESGRGGSRRDVGKAKTRSTDAECTKMRKCYVLLERLSPLALTAQSPTPPSEESGEHKPENQDGAVRKSHIQKGDGAVRKSHLQKGDGAVRKSHIQKRDGAVRKSHIQKRDGAVRKSHIQKGGGAVRRSHIQKRDGAVRKSHIKKRDGAVRKSHIQKRDGAVRKSHIQKQDGAVRKSHIQKQDPKEKPDLMQLDVECTKMKKCYVLLERLSPPTFTPQSPTPPSEESGEHKPEHQDDTVRKNQGQKGDPTLTPPTFTPQSPTPPSEESGEHKSEHQDGTVRKNQGQKGDPTLTPPTFTPQSPTSPSEESLEHKPEHQDGTVRKNQGQKGDPTLTPPTFTPQSPTPPSEESLEHKPEHQDGTLTRRQRQKLGLTLTPPIPTPPRTTGKYVRKRPYKKREPKEKQENLDSDPDFDAEEFQSELDEEESDYDDFDKSDWDFDVPCFDAENAETTENAGRSGSDQEDKVKDSENPGLDFIPSSSITYECPFCKRIFDSNRRLERHVKCHEIGRGSKKCPKCHWVFFGPSLGLRNHMKMHRNGNPNECFVCGKVYLTPSLLRMHMQSHSTLRPFTCDTCGKKFSTKYSLENHKAVHMDVKLYLCTVCGHASQTINSFSRHKKLFHSGNYRHTCKICSKGFVYKSELRQHMETHKANPLACSECDQVLEDKISLKIHLDLHMLQSSFICSVCNKYFLSQAHLDEHAMIHSADNPYRCDQCGKEYLNGSQLRQHMKSHSKKSAAGSTADAGNTMLSGGGKTTKTKPSLVCSVCGKSFQGKVKLEKHINTRHKGQKPYQCPECSMGYADLSGLKKHLLDHRQGKVKQFPCPHCDQPFPSYRRIHEHLAELGIKKPHTCSVCGRCFKEKFDLNNHFRQHTGEKPFVCELCGNTYPRKGSLYTHMKLTHKKKLGEDEVSTAVSNLYPEFLSNTVEPIPNTLELNDGNEEHISVP